MNDFIGTWVHPDGTSEEIVLRTKIGIEIFVKGQDIIRLFVPFQDYKDLLGSVRSLLSFLKR
jgi:hypothetical protein